MAKLIDTIGLAHFWDKIKETKGTSNGLAGLDKNGFVEKSQLSFISNDIIYFTKRVYGTTMASVGSSLINPKQVVFDATKNRFVATNDANPIYTNCQPTWAKTAEDAYNASSDFGSQDGTKGIIPKKNVLYYNEDDKKTYKWTGTTLVAVDYSINATDTVKHVFFNMRQASNKLTHDITVGDNKFGIYFAPPFYVDYTTYSDPRNSVGSDLGYPEVQTIGVTLYPASASHDGFMSKTQATQLSSLYSAHNGKTYLPLSGGTVTGYTNFNGGLNVNGGATVRGEGIEMYASTPFIDFHYGNSTADYTSRIIESSSGKIDINNIIFDKQQGIVIPTNYHTKYESWLAQSYINDFGGKAECSFQVYTSNGDWRFVRQTKANVDVGDGQGNHTYIRCHSNGNVEFCNASAWVDSTGNVAALAFYETSDKRLKENINKIETSDIDKVSKVQLKEFNFKNDDKKIKRYGVIAQELEEIGLNNLVTENSETGNKSVDYISFLILKIKELENRINELENKIKD